MATFTSSLPDGLLKLLEEKAKELSMPKNKLIEQALRLYLDHLNRAAYIRSYKQMAEDTDLMSIAEEGMADYYEQLENETR
jgi:metal-responsive CopG/Arc/MetJ family transcriptional regulator